MMRPLRLHHCRFSEPSGRDMLLSRHLMCLCVLLAGTWGVTASAQTSNPTTIARSSNLSAALAPEDWQKVEIGVDRGLAWLAAQQAEDGSFPGIEVAQPATTSLAVMAFLSRGHLPGRGNYGQKLDRAIDYVLATQRSRGVFSLIAPVPPAIHLSAAQTVHYNHAIAGLMLGEVYGMTNGERSERIEIALHRALLYHREVQTWGKQLPTDVGGFRYGAPEAPNASSDLSVTGWGLMFYRSARNAEFNVPKAYFDEGLDFVERCYETDPALHLKGVFRYRPKVNETDAPQITLPNTSSAALTLILGGRQDRRSVQAAIQWIEGREYPRLFGESYFYLGTYYTSQALAQVGGAPWNKVYPQIAHNLLEVQTKSGAWPGGPQSERTYGESYSTSLAILALTPPYQLLPIFQR